MDKEGDSGWEFSRRQLVAGAAGVLGIGVVASSPAEEESPDISGAVGELQSLADDLNQQDLTDPLSTAFVQARISEQLTAAESQLSEEGIDRSTVPEDQEIATKSGIGISDINSAFQYYDTLDQVLSTADSVSDRVESREIAALYREDLTNFALQKIPMTQFESAINNLGSTREQFSTGQQSTSVNKLLPSRKAVEDGLTGRMSVYVNHLNMQDSLLECGANIAAGATAFENSKLKQAKKNFQVFEQSATVSVPSNLTAYSVDQNLMTVGEYSTVFEKYRGAAAKFLASCSEEKARRERNEEFDAGLEKLFEVRGIFTRIL